jgi:hypothetical protein
VYLSDGTPSCASFNIHYLLIAVQFDANWHHVTVCSVCWQCQRTDTTWLCSLWISLCVRHHQMMCDRSWTGMPLKHRCTTQDLVPEALFNHFEVFRSTFPKIGTKFDAPSLFLCLIHRKNRHGSRTRLQINACKNCPHQSHISETWQADSLNMVVLPYTGASP